MPSLFFLSESVRCKKWVYLLDLISVLLRKELKVRYKSSTLGYLWSIAQPLSFSLVFVFAFKIVMRVQSVENYPLFLLAGLFPWQWFANSVNSSTMTFLSNASIIKKINFPRYTLVIASVCQDAVHFLLTIPILVGYLLYSGNSPSLTWVYGIPFLFAIQFLLVCGLALFVSSFNLFFRDLERVVSIVVSLAFYLTPVVYPANQIPAPIRSWIHFNPLADIISCWRELLLSNTLSFQGVLVSMVHAGLFLGLGVITYRFLSKRFAEVL
jgi:lipopolysaccharide transport system permease protein